MNTAWQHIEHDIVIRDYYYKSNRGAGNAKAELMVYGSPYLRAVVINHNPTGLIITTTLVSGNDKTEALSFAENPELECLYDPKQGWNAAETRKLVIGLEQSALA